MTETSCYRCLSISLLCNLILSLLSRLRCDINSTSTLASKGSKNFSDFRQIALPPSSSQHHTIIRIYSIKIHKSSRFHFDRSCCCGLVLCGAISMNSLEKTHFVFSWERKLKMSNGMWSPWPTRILTFYTTGQNYTRSCPFSLVVTDLFQFVALSFSELEEGSMQSEEIAKISM